LNAKISLMKNLRNKIEHYVLEAENYWKMLPVAKQRFLTKIFFGVYLFLTVIVVVSVCISTGQRSNTISINHIDGVSKKSIEKKSGQNGIVNSSIKK